MSKILADDEIAKDINFLNSNQRKALNVALTWTNNHGKDNGYNVETIYIFLSGCGDREICHLVKVIYDAISKTLIHYYKDHEKLNDLLLRPTETPAVNIGGIIIYFGLTFKSGT